MSLKVDPANTESLIIESGEALKSLDTTDGKTRVGAYAIRFSGPDEKDLTGDYFTKETFLGPRSGDGAMAIFNHGMAIRKGLEGLCDRTFGEVSTKVDDVGVFASCVLDLSDKYEAAIASLCAKGKLKWSSGSASHLAKKGDDGRILRWPIVEFSFTPTPVESRLPAIRPLKSLTATDADALAIAEACGVDTAQISEPPANIPKKSITIMEKTAEQLAAEKAQQDAIKSAVKTRETEVNEILGLAARYNATDKAGAFISEGKSITDFQKFILTDHLKPGKAVDFNQGAIGMDDKDISRFSVLKAINDLATGGRLTGLEKECSDEAAKKYGREVKGLGLVIPDEVLRSPVSLRGHAIKAGNFIGTATTGGYLMQPELGPLIELLRNKPRVVEAGATTLTGLVGDMYLPRQTAGVAASWQTETGTISDGNATFEQVKLTPKRLGCTIPYSMQFIAQTSYDAESVIRNDAILQLALAKDLAALHGSGVAGQPLGIANTTGIKATVTYGGAAEWADVIQHETGIATSNADIGAMAFLLDAATVGKWKSIAKVSNYPSFLIDSDMTANGYPVKRTNQIVGSVSFFGVFSQLYLASWAGLSVIVDPYTLATSGQVRITFQELCDNCLRHPESFNVSTDSAAQ